MRELVILHHERHDPAGSDDRGRLLLQRLVERHSLRFPDHSGAGNRGPYFTSSISRTRV
jgi:hypothetical protein